MILPYRGWVDCVPGNSEIVFFYRVPVSTRAYFYYSWVYARYCSITVLVFTTAVAIDF